MNVNKKTDVLYSILDITPTQAEDLLSICVCHEAEFSESEEETLSNLRQALLSAGIEKKG